MNGVKQGILKSILDFMYLGEVRINQEEFTDFIRVAELFKIRGVTRDVVSIIWDRIREIELLLFIFRLEHCGCNKEFGRYSIARATY